MTFKSSSLRREALLSVAREFIRRAGFALLVEYLIEHDSCGDGYVERVAASDHWDSHHFVAQRLQVLRQAFSLAAQQEDGGGCHVIHSLVIQGSLRRGAYKLPATFLLPPDELVYRRPDETLGEQRAHAGPHCCRVIRVGCIA